MEDASNNRSVAQPPVQTQHCPRCNTTIPVLKGYTTWCEHCGWNVEPFNRDPPGNVFDATYAELGKRHSRQLLERMRDEKNLRPALTPRLVAALAVAALVPLLALSVALLGVWLLFAGYCVMFVVGLLCLTIAWVLRPRVLKVPHESAASRSDFPALYRLADQVAEAIGARPVDVIRLGGTFNTMSYLAGWQRKRVIYLGLPLLSILNAPERVAMLGQALGYFLKGEITRKFALSTALNTLVGWYWLLYPGIARRGAKRAGAVGGAPRLPDAVTLSTTIPMTYSTAIPTKLIMFGLSQVPRFWAYALIKLTWSDAQRAVYLADSLGAKAAGTAATISALNKVYLRDTIKSAIGRAALDPNSDSEDLFADLQHYANQVPEREWEHIRRSQALDSSGVDFRQPLTKYRLELLRAHQVSQPAIVLSEAEFQEIERELSKVSHAIQKSILDNERWVSG